MRCRALLVPGLLLSAAAWQAVAAAESKPVAARLDPGQIVEKFEAARGGLQAWRAAQTLSVTGKLDAGTADAVARSTTLAEGGEGASVRRRGSAATAAPGVSVPKQQVQLPFRMELKRPRMSRLEIDFAGKTAVQVYDGQNGWKVRPYLNRNEVEPFTEEEAKADAEQDDLEGPLFDYAVKGTKVALEGVEPVKGHDAYKLKLTTKTGDVKHIWIDTQSFLDVKIEGTPRRMDGQTRSVSIYQGDFRAVQGLMVPFLYETAIEGNPQTHKMIVETVAVNRALEDSRFVKPQILVAGSAAAPAAAAGAKK
jgi:hypothetical protein